MKLTARRVAMRSIWLVLALVLLWWAVRSVALADVWAQLSRLQPQQLALLALVNGVLLAAFSARWWLLLYAQGYVIPYGRLIGYRLATFAVSYLTPGPHFGGEPLQVYLVSRNHGVPVSAALTAVILDKSLEMTTNFTFLVAGVLFVYPQVAAPGWPVGQLLLAGCLLLLLPLGLLIAISLRRHPLSALIALAQRAWSRITGGGSGLAGESKEQRLYRIVHDSERLGAELCRKQPALVLLALAASVISWVGIIGEFWLMTKVLGLGLSLPQALAALLAARIAILLPLPAALGALEASQTLAMAQLGLAPAAGISMSVLIRGRDIMLAILGLGVGGMTFAPDKRLTSARVPLESTATMPTQEPPA